MDSPLLRALRRTERWLRRAIRPTYTHVVPLGLSCRVTYQLRTYFGCRLAYPFDWWISPFGGLTSYLADPDPHRIYRSTALVERRGAEGIEAIECAELGLQLFHEFPRLAASAGPSVVAPGWQAHLPQAAERHGRRLARLLALDRPENRLLFVRHRAGAEATSFLAGDEIALLLSILRLRFPRASVTLLLLNVPVQGEIRPEVDRLYFNDSPGTPPEEWRGAEACWRGALAAGGFRLKGSPCTPPGPLPSPGEAD